MWAKWKEIGQFSYVLFEATQRWKKWKIKKHIKAGESFVILLFLQFFIWSETLPLKPWRINFAPPLKYSQCILVYHGSTLRIYKTNSQQFHLVRKNKKYEFRDSLAIH